MNNKKLNRRGRSCVSIPPRHLCIHARHAEAQRKISLFIFYAEGVENKKTSATLRLCGSIFVLFVSNE